MPPRSDVHEEWAIKYLKRITELAEADPGALPPTVVRLVRQAIVILKKRRPAMRR